MAHVYALHIGSSHNDDMLELVEHFFDYFDDVPPTESLSDNTSFSDVTAGQLKTVADVKKLGMFTLDALFYAVIEGTTPYWNMCHCIPDDVMEQVYEKLFDCYEDDTPVKVFNIHI